MNIRFLTECYFAKSSYMVLCFWRKPAQPALVDKNLFMLLSVNLTAICFVFVQLFFELGCWYSSAKCGRLLIITNLPNRWKDAFTPKTFFQHELKSKAFSSKLSFVKKEGRKGAFSEILQKDFPMFCRQISERRGEIILSTKHISIYTNVCKY